MSDESAQVRENIILVCDSVVLKFRAGTSSKAILARAKDKWGPGTITDNEGYEVTDESPVLATDQYEYQRSSASHLQTVVVDKTARKYEPVEDEISLAGIVDMLLWHIWRCIDMYDQGPKLGELKKSIRCILHALERPLHTSGTYQKGAARVVHSTMVKKL
ncbi:hypothetical protein WJX77_008835 [Trebouxia sp. C0004]